MTPDDTAAAASAAPEGPPRKRCPQCTVPLLLSAFAKNATSPDGLQSTCRSCQREYRAAWSAKNKDKAKDRMRGFHTKPLAEDRSMADPVDEAATIESSPTPTTSVTQDVSGLEATTSSGRARAGRAHDAPTTMGDLTIAAIVPSLTNPRKHFDQAALQELADSIRLQGLAQPILVRPLPGSRLAETYSDRRAGAPRPTHEVVAGERRWRACQMAGVRRIPVLIRDLNDTEVLQLQLVENLKRRDLHPMEEAEGYERLRRHTGMTTMEIAESIGQGKSYVYKTLQLLDLEPEAREAFYAGKLTRVTAELVSKHPPHMQIQLLKEIIATDYAGDPMSFRKAKALIEDRYMLRLADAPFDTKDPLLVPAAGACPACPKRTGANPELFDDVSRRDSCTDVACFALKKAAHYEHIRIDAEARGMTVLVGKEAREIMPTPDTLRGYVNIDDPHALGGQMKTLRTVMGDNLPKATLVEHPTSHEMVAVLPTTVVGDLLRKQGIAKAAAQESPQDQERRLVERVESTWRTRAIEAVFSETEKRICGLGPVVMRLIGTMLVDNLQRDQRQHVCKLLSIGAVGDTEGIKAALRDCEPGMLESLLLLLLMEHDMPNLVSIGGQATKAERIEAVAADVGVDLGALRVQAREELAAEMRPPKPAKKGKTTAAEAQAAIAQQLQALDPMQAAA